MDTVPLKTSLSDLESLAHPDVVLVQAPWWGVEIPPIALASLTAYLRQRDYRVLPLDLNLDCYLNSVEKYRNSWRTESAFWWWTTYEQTLKFVNDHQELFDHYVERLVAARPKVVGFSVYMCSVFVSAYLARRIKEVYPEVTIVFGGPQADRALSAKVLAEKDYIDLVVYGEGEAVLEEIVARAVSGQRLEECPGTMYCRGDGTVVDCGDRPLLKNINELPVPDFSDYDFHSYVCPTKLPMITSRGCVNDCAFCSEVAFWSIYRGLRGERMFAEVQAQVEKYPFIEHIVFQDSLINGWMKELEVFADLLIASDLNIKWSGQAIIRKDMTYEFMKKLRDSGCEKLSFGLETASQPLMLKIGKRLAKDADIDAIVRDAHRAGLACTYNFMFGLPGETEEDAQETLAFLRRNRDYLPTVSPSHQFCAFLPGSLGHRDPKKYGITNVDSSTYWESDDGANNYLVRLRRFEEFCGLADDLGINNIYPARQLLDRERHIADYYYYVGKYSQAAPYYEQWIEKTEHDEVSAARLADCHQKLGEQDAVVHRRQA